MVGVKGTTFFRDTRGVDTIPLKMVFYLAVTAAIIFLVAFSWNNLSPIYSGAKDSEQINDAALELLSIQNGYARTLQGYNDPQGSTCSVKLSLPDVDYLAFGVDPDPDMNGNLNDTQWTLENNTIICQYKNGVKDRYDIDGNVIYFRKGKVDNSGIWVLDDGQNKSENMGVVIEGPISGNFDLELVLADKKYTLSHF
ncbi:MAG: hypothetical protein RBT65_09915 [Methanolobus sp.]|nr:hypothetical protein [Methanolobus sp.]